MTEQELSSLFFLKKDIARLEKRISALREDSAGFQSISLSVKKAELKTLLSEKLEEKIEAEILIRNYIENIKDPQIKEIAELRFLDQMSWVDIAAEVSPKWKDFDRTTVAKKLRKYLKEN